MSNEDENLYFNQSEIVIEKNKIKLKSNKKYNSYKITNNNSDLESLELICFILFFILAFSFIIASIILYISKSQKHFITEEDNNKLAINNYIETNSNMNELERADFYCELCDKGLLIRKGKFKKVTNPKITIIIITNNNEEKEILRILRSIQNQNFDDVEIIFLDNLSKENTIKLIEKYQKEDERIILIKNKEKKEKLMNIKNGLLNSKGEYILIADPNDLYADKIFEISYNIAKNNNYDIIGFNILTVYIGMHYLDYEHKVDIPINQPELSSIMFYEKGHISLTDKIIWNKLIKKEALINAINYINNEYFNYNLDINGDSMLIFSLFKTAKSFYFIKNSGYIYVGNHGSLSNSFSSNMDEVFNDFISYLKFIFENTNNTKYEKDMAFEIFRNQYHSFYNKKKPHERINKNLEYYIQILDLYYNCEFISKKDKQLVESVKNNTKSRLDELNKKKEKKKRNKNY